MYAPCHTNDKIAENGKGACHQEDADDEGESQLPQPGDGCGQPRADGAPIEFRRRYEDCIAAHDGLPDPVGEDVQRDKGDRVGIERGEDGERQIDAENDGAQCRADHLERRGQQAAEQPGRHAACRRAPIQVPQARMQQRIAKRRQPAVFADGGVVRGKAA